MVSVGGNGGDAIAPQLLAIALQIDTTNEWKGGEGIMLKWFIIHMHKVPRP